MVVYVKEVICRHIQKLKQIFLEEKIIFIFLYFANIFQIYGITLTIREI